MWWIILKLGMQEFYRLTRNDLEEFRPNLQLTDDTRKAFGVPEHDGHWPSSSVGVVLRTWPSCTAVSGMSARQCSVLLYYFKCHNFNVPISLEMMLCSL